MRSKCLDSKSKPTKSLVVGLGACAVLFAVVAVVKKLVSEV